MTTKTFTLCGTPEYLVSFYMFGTMGPDRPVSHKQRRVRCLQAPEVFMSQGHDQAADLWSYGVLLYELISGRSAFYKHGQKQVDMFKSIVRVKYEVPPSVDDVSKDLVQKLLVRNPAKRLGNLSNGAQDIEDHPWFSSMDWKALPKKELPAPWIPEIKEGAAVTETNFADAGGAYRDLSLGKPLSMEEQSFFKSF